MPRYFFCLVEILYERLASIRHVALDMDGTIYKGSTLFPETLPFLALLKELGIGHTFLTNNSSKSLADYVEHLRKFGIAAGPNEIFTSTLATIEFLRAEHSEIKQLFVLGTTSLRKELEGAGFIMTEDNPADEPDAVVTGFDTELTFSRLCRAAWWIKQGKPYFATHPDRICPTNEPTVLVDCGAICAALKEATDRQPDAVLGKPDPRMLQGLMQRFSLKPENLAMVGDRLYTDVAMARRSGAVGILVLTGETTSADVHEAEQKPDLTVSNLAELGERLRQGAQA
jgi:NagD protein